MGFKRLNLCYTNQSVNVVQGSNRICSQIHTKQTNTVCVQKEELLTVKLAVHIGTTGL